MTEQTNLGDFATEEDADDENEEEVVDEDTDDTSGPKLLSPEEAIEQGYEDVESALERGRVSHEWAVEHGYIDPTDESDPEELGWEDYREDIADDAWGYCTAHLNEEQRDALRQAVDDRLDGMAELNAALLLPNQDVVDRTDGAIAYAEVAEMHRRFLDVDRGVAVLGSSAKQAKQRWRLKRPQPDRLLYEFGSVEEIADASREELEAVEGVGPATAERIVEDDVSYHD